jgi:nucleotide-binding universal stress UspA family protein
MSSHARTRSGHRRSRADRSHVSPPALIAVGVDGGSSGRDAVALASLLASAMSGELMLIAVYEEPLLEGVIPAEVGWRSVKQQARAMLAQTRDSIAPSAGIVVEPDVFAWRALRRVVRRERRELLVVGSGRDAADGCVSLGRSAQELVGRLECPLAIAPEGMADRDLRRLERIGVGYDDQPEAQAALDLAGTIALAATAELDVCAVADDRVPGGLTTEQVVLGGDAIMTEETGALLDRTLAATRGFGAPARVAVSAGSPPDALSALGAGVDLLVIGSSGSGRAGRVSVGRTGKALAGGAPCPVLIVPRSVR